MLHISIYLSGSGEYLSPYKLILSGLSYYNQLFIIFSDNVYQIWKHLQTSWFDFPINQRVFVRWCWRWEGWSREQLLPWLRPLKYFWCQSVSFLLRYFKNIDMALIGLSVMEDLVLLRWWCDKDNVMSQNMMVIPKIKIILYSRSYSIHQLLSFLGFFSISGHT